MEQMDRRGRHYFVERGASGLAPSGYHKGYEMMFMLKSTHEKALAGVIKQERDKRDMMLNVELSIINRQRATISELRPAADKWNAKLERDRAYAANKRKAAK